MAEVDQGNLMTLCLSLNLGFQGSVCFPVWFRLHPFLFKKRSVPDWGRKCMNQDYPSPQGLLISYLPVQQMSVYVCVKQESRSLKLWQHECDLSLTAAFCQSLPAPTFYALLVTFLELEVKNLLCAAILKL